MFRQPWTDIFLMPHRNTPFSEVNQSVSIQIQWWHGRYHLYLTLIRLGGGPWWPPLDISRDYSATREAFAATLYDNFLSSFPHILTPILWRPGVRFRSYVTLCTCTSDRKWLQNVILCTKSMQIEFSHLVHINMHIFTLNCWN